MPGVYYTILLNFKIHLTAYNDVRMFVGVLLFNFCWSGHSNGFAALY